MEKIGLNLKIFLIVNMKGEILYSSDDIKFMGLTKGDILEIIERKKTPEENYEFEVKKIRGEYEEFYVMVITCKDTKKLLYLDACTNLYNRNLWEWIRKNGLKKEKKDINTLVIIDIDNLKDINDAYGHNKGDECIKLVAESIKTCIREDDLPFRFGGDEFVILLFKTKKNQAKRVVKRIRSKVRKKSKEIQKCISISAGISKFTSLDDLDRAFEDADKDMYKEKREKMIKTFV